VSKRPRRGARWVSTHGTVPIRACLGVRSQMRNNGEALVQLIDAAEAIPHVVGLLGPEHPPDIQEQGALLLGMLTSQFLEAKASAVKVRQPLHLLYSC